MTINENKTDTTTEAKRAPKSLKGSIRSCGRLNLTTGKNKHFNVLDDWSDSDGSRVTLMTSVDEMRLVGGWGDYVQGDQIEQHRDSPGAAYIGQYTVIADSFPATSDGLDDIKRLIGEKTIAFSVWK